MKLTAKQNKDRVQIEVVILDERQGWDTSMVWVPRKVAESGSQDAFLTWVYSDDGAAWRETWNSVSAVYVHNFSFEEPGDDSVFVEAGTKVRVARGPGEDESVGFSGDVGDVGEMRDAGRIGPDSGHALIDLLLSNGNEVTVFSHQLDENTE